MPKERLEIAPVAHSGPHDGQIGLWFAGCFSVSGNGVGVGVRRREKGTSSGVGMDIVRDMEHFRRKRLL